MGNVKLMWITPEAEKLILYMARVSSEKQDSENTKLINYLIEHKHWSPFEMSSMCVEIHTTRAIAPQILRHRSFVYQERSLRYADIKNLDFEIIRARRQDLKNKQNSIDNMSNEDLMWFDEAQGKVVDTSIELYQEALDRGIAKECARFLLPLSTPTKLYMSGTIRSWIHYLEVRTEKSTQKEHRDIAQQAQDIFIDNLPIISEALQWKRNMPKTLMEVLEKNGLLED